MFNVEVRYRGKPIKTHKATGVEIEHKDNYTIRDEVNERDHRNAMRKEITKIFKKYKAVFSIKFYV